MQQNNCGLLIVLSGPSGAGKDSVLAQLKCQYENIQLSISVTTRAPRPGEQDGEHYFFVTREAFEEKLRNNQILEYTEYNGNYYGTPMAYINDGLALGKTVILEIEVEGAANVRRLYPNCVSVFLVPPSLAVLRQRLIDRKTESPEEINRRIAIAKQELNHAKNYDYIILNDKLNHAVQDFGAVIRANQLDTTRQNKLLEEVQADA